MGFVSVLEFKSKRRSTSLPAFIKFRLGTSGSCSGNVSSGTGLKGLGISIEIDQESRIIRVARNETKGIKCEGRSGLFSCSVSVFDIVGCGRIYLTKHDDGWFYGEF